MRRFLVITLALLLGCPLVSDARKPVTPIIAAALAFVNQTGPIASVVLDAPVADTTYRVSIYSETQAIDFRGGPFTTAFRQIPLDQTTGITDVQVGEPGRTYKSGSGTNSFCDSSPPPSTLARSSSYRIRSCSAC